MNFLPWSRSKHPAPYSTFPPACTETPSSMNPKEDSVPHFPALSLAPPLCCCPSNDPRGSTPGLPVHHPLPKLAQTRVLCVSDAIQPSRPLSPPLLLLPSILPSIRVFSKELALYIRWSFNFSISPSNEYSGLISFRIDWFDFLTLQGTLKSLLQHQNLKASSLWRSAFFMVQLLQEKP